MAFIHSLAALVETASNNLGLIAIGAGIAILTGGFSSLGESWIACHAIDAISRNPERQGKFQSLMILSIALDESCAIYALIIAFMILFVLGGKVA